MQSILRNYLVWIILGVLLIAALAMQFFLVDSKRQQVMAANKNPVATLKNAKTLSSSIRDIPTRGDVDAALAQQRVIRKQHSDIRKNLYEYTEGLNRFMSNGRNPLGELNDPRTGVPDPDRADRQIGHQPIEWSVFPVTVHQLYNEMLSRAVEAMRDQRLEKTRDALADRLYAKDNTLTLETANERAASEAPGAVARDIRALFAGGRDAFNRVTDLNDVFNPRLRPEDRERGWRVWREFLIDSDLLERVLPQVEVEMNVGYWAKMPLEPAERAQYVAARLADRLGPEQIYRPSREWSGRKVTRFVERISPVEILEIELGEVDMPAANDPNLPPEAAEQPIPEGRVYDRYRLRLSITAHPSVVTAFVRKLMSVESGMLYVPVSTTIHRFPDEIVLNVSATEPGAGREGRGSEYSSSRERRSTRRGGEYYGQSEQQQQQQGGREAAETTPAARASVGYDYEPAVDAVLILDLYRYRFSNTDNETPAAAPEGEDTGYGGGYGGGPY